MKTITFSLSICIALVGITNAQQNKRQAVISNFATTTNAKITTNSSTGTPQFIRFSQDQTLSIQGASANEKAINFLETNKELYGLTSVSEELKLNNIETDRYGLQQVEFRQEYKGIPIYDGILKFHYDQNNNITAINGNIISVNDLSTKPNISSNDAAQKAITSVNNQNINQSGKSIYNYATKLYVFQTGLAQNKPGIPLLVYEVEVRNGFDVREFVFVNAHNGKIVEQYTGISRALNREVYDGLFSPVLIWQEGDAFPGTLNLWQRNEVVASGHVYNFFKNVFGRDSYDDKGGVMQTVNLSSSLPFCPNAFWTGEATYYCEGAASDDVIAHEWGHAYTQYTSNLIYAYQSGALNESFSDIWGETIDLLNNYEDDDEDLSKRTGCESSDRWQLGEDATAFGEPIRDMWKPSCKSLGDDVNYPDDLDEYLCLSPGFDSGGVHINSSIPNHAYSLLVDGGTHNYMRITGIGFTKAAHIFWRAQSQYLTQTSDFIDFSNALQASARDLFGLNLEGLTVNEIPAGPSGERISFMDIVQIELTLAALGLRNDIDHCNFKPILSPIDALCDNATDAPIYKEDWENGLGDWTVTQLAINEGTWTPRDWVLTSDLPENRSGKAMFAIDPLNGDCIADLQNGILRLESPEITITNVFDNYEMAVSHYIATEAGWSREEDAFRYYDGGNVKVSLNGGDWLEIPAEAFTANPYNATLYPNTDNPMEGQAAFAGTNEGENKGSWGTSIVDLSALGVNSGDSLKFRFELGTDGCNGQLGWYVDDIMIYSCNDEGVLSSVNSKLEESISIYPNPSVNGIFNLKTNDIGNLTKAEVYDINGRLIKTVKLLNNSKIDLLDVKAGVYFMKINSNTEKGVFKLIKN